jgi:HPt (histidine-containing phosphotransfer) domain-containing protein
MTGSVGRDQPLGKPSDHLTAHRYKIVEREWNLDPEAPPLPVSGDSSVSTLERDVGPEVYQELLGSFVTLLSVQTVELTTAGRQRDLQSAQFIAHQIMGTASSFGAVRLHELAARLMQIEESQIELLRFLVREIDSEVASFRGAVGA